ncbi:MAG: helix-turn-helix domain-containing protein [Bacteroidales bacterium]|nr:helix-turn-helix domain-containing protein [Bacteroidales bacterium]
MADRIGVSRNAYRGLEKGKTAILNPKLKEISKCLGMEVDDILSLAYPKGVLQDSQESFYITSISRLEENVKVYEQLVKSQEKRINDLEEKVAQQRQTIEMQSRQNKAMSERLAQYEGND